MHSREILHGAPSAVENFFEKRSPLAHPSVQAIARKTDLLTENAKVQLRDCPKRGLSNALKVNSDVMRRPKWVETSLLGDL
jgi:hypothetical protein